MYFVLDISYKGTNYHGWQIQNNALTIQNVINSALSTLLLHGVATLGSGRTDTGVHARQQFVQFETGAIGDYAKFVFQLNAILPKDIFVKHLYTTQEGFNVRFDAVKRTYVYQISLQKNPFLIDLCCFYFQRSVDVNLLNECSKLLLEENDYQSFSKYKTNVNHFDCNIYEAYWESVDDMLYFNITANRFLRGMVRALVGTLLEVGTKKIDINKFQEIMLARDRKAAKHAVPAQGLFLSKVDYPQGKLILLF